MNHYIISPTLRSFLVARIATATSLNTPNTIAIITEGIKWPSLAKIDVNSITHLHCCLSWKPHIQSSCAQTIQHPCFISTNKQTIHQIQKRGQTSKAAVTCHSDLKFKKHYSISLQQHDSTVSEMRVRSICFPSKKNHNYNTEPAHFSRHLITRNRW